jgi:biotin synthase
MIYTLNKVTRPLPSFFESLETAVSGKFVSHDKIISLIQATEKEEIKALHDAAGDLTKKLYNNQVSIRGIVEFSNACEKSCLYCGVNAYEEKFLIPHEAILECCDFMWKKGYRNLVLQSGEISSKARMDWITSLLEKIFAKYGSDMDTGMCVILSIGELSHEQYQKFYDMGCQRYLLRIEASNPELYKSIHPPDHLWSKRVACLEDLKKIGYVTGTGVMIGLPKQTYDDIAGDIEFIRDGQYPMVGLGPYLIHNETVLGRELLKTTEDERKEADLRKVQATLNVYDAIRLICPYVNIAATTALDTLSPGAKEIALTGGANVVMPIITPKKFRGGYQLYEGKKEVDEDREQTHQRIIDLCEKLGKVAIFNKWNHPLLYNKLHPNWKHSK